MKKVSLLMVGFLLVALIAACQTVATTTTETTTQSSVTTPSTTTETTPTTTTSTIETTTTTPIPGLVVSDGSDYGVYYEIFVRSFADSDGNGVGDFNGITAKLDYLMNLGIHAIWLMPITESPSYHGYDVTDYYEVNSDYGTMADFENMVIEAESRGISVMLDMVFNHTSSNHPWFQAALNGNATYQNYYHFVESSVNLPGAWHTAGNLKYYGYFSGSMPDLNFESQAVLQELLNISAFWIDKGVRGFRMDAVHHFFGIQEDPEMEDVSYHTNVDWLAQFNALLDEYQPGVFLLGEVYEEGLYELVGNYYEGLDAPLDFPTSALLRSTAAKNSVFAYSSLLKRYYDKYRLVEPNFISFPFVVNHDMNRAATLFGGDSVKMRMVTEMLMTLPGNPIIYYGEEIGMYGAKANGPIYDETRRLPIMWGDEYDTNWLQSSDPTFVLVNNQNGTVDNVAAQLEDPASLLRLYRDLISVREENIALKYGNNFNTYENSTSYVQGFYRECRYEGNYQKVLVLHNLSAESQTISFPAGAAVLYLSGTSSVDPVTVMPPKTTLILDVTPQE